MKAVIWQHRSRRLTRSDVDRVEPVWKRARGGSRNFFGNLYGSVGSSIGNCRVPLKSKIADWLWRSALLCSLSLAIATREPQLELRAVVLDTFQHFRLSLVSCFGSACCSAFSHVFKLTFGALYCKVLFSEPSHGHVFRSLYLLECLSCFCSCFWPLQKVPLFFRTVLWLEQFLYCTVTVFCVDVCFIFSYLLFAFILFLRSLC